MTEQMPENVHISSTMVMEKEQEEKDRLLHFLCHVCEAETLLGRMFGKSDKKIKAVCGYEFPEVTGGDVHKGNGKCIVCTDLAPAHYGHLGVGDKNAT